MKFFFETSSWLVVGVFLWFGASPALRAETVWSGIPTADAFVATGSAANPAGTDLTANNYGGAGALSVSAAGSAKGETQTLLRFDLAPALASFDSVYGAGLWQITSITLTLTGNFGVQGAQPNNGIFNAINSGSFTITWLSDDAWDEGAGNPSSPSATGVNFDSLAALVAGPAEGLGTFTYVPPGNNVPLDWSLGLASGFVADAASGGAVSLLLSAADAGVSYNFNSRSFGTAGNRPLLTVVAVPEPSAFALLAVGIGVIAAIRRRA